MIRTSLPSQPFSGLRRWMVSTRVCLFVLGCLLLATGRALLERRFAARTRQTIIISGSDSKAPRIGKWEEGADGSLGRICILPRGMTMQEAERIVLQPGWKPTAPPAKPERIRPPLKPEW